jgi:O-antigen ligase/Flp pilus assembly protein TadD
MEVAVFVLVALWMIRIVLGAPAARRTTSPRIASTIIPLILFGALLVFQLVPLPPSVERVLFPTTYEVYLRSLRGWPVHTPYGEQFSLISKPQASAVLLPTPEEVRAGTPVPFAAPAKQPTIENHEKWNLFARSPELERIFTTDWTGRFVEFAGRWRPLSISPAATEAALLKFLAYASLFALVLLYPLGDSFKKESEERFRHRIVSAILLAGLLEGAIALIGGVSADGKVLGLFSPYDWHGGSGWGTRATGTFANPDHLANYLVLVLPLAIAGVIYPHLLFGKGRRDIARWFCGVVGLVALTALVASGSRGGWAGAVIGVAMLVWLSMSVPQEARPQLLRISHRPAAAISSGLIILAISALLAAGPSSRNQADERLGYLIANESIGQRLTPAKVSIGIIRDFPLLGVGFGCWPQAVPRYQQPPWSNVFWNAAHNDYAQLASETGLIGSLLVAWFFTAVVLSFYRSFGTLSPHGKILVAASVGALAASALHEFFDFPLQIPANALLLTLLLALALRAGRTAVENGQPRRSGLAKCGAFAGMLIALVTAFFALRQANSVPYPYVVKPVSSIEQARAQVLSYPASARAHLQLLSFLGDRMVPADRMEEIKRAIWLEPTDPLPRDLYAQTLLGQKQEPKALAEITRSVFLSPSLVTHFYLLPRLLPWLPTAQRKAVEEGFKMAMAQHFDGAVMGLANFYDTLGNYVDEASVCELAARSEQDQRLRTDYWLVAGIARSRVGAWEDAKADLRQAAVASPTDPRPYQYLLSLVYLPKKDLVNAKATAAEGVRRGADARSLYISLAEVEQSLGDKTGAEKAFLRAYAFRPADADVTMRLGLLYLSDGKFNRAAMWMRKTTQLKPDRADAFFYLGIAEEASYQYFTAEKAYKRALKLAPNNTTFRARHDAFHQKLVSLNRDIPSP